MSDPLGEHDNIVAAYQVEDRAVRGRACRLGSTLDAILSAHAYPDQVARLLGEAVIIAALVGDALKFDGRLIVQANGSGPIQFIVAEYVAGEGVRGFAKIDRDAVDAALAERPGPDMLMTRLMGKGAFAMTIDYGPDKDQYQGVVGLEGPSLSAAAEAYFTQSEQTPTRLRIAVGESWKEGEDRAWRGGGLMLQAVAGDETRGSAEADWDHARALFETVEDAELLDPDLSAGGLLFRLFNEDGVRLLEPRHVARRCSCERERLLGIIASFPAEDRAEMETGGEIVMTCEYCNRDWRFDPAEVSRAAG
ncbi:Hsp33 family molecular chaperone [Maricaulis sp.]|uniref:Hsp33 family molecular chaperone n=1 Tax=Maricaulis sp. TaxID=1486257 RepID=UPI00262C536D|nr:Hsp33 family molecular chaperone [Maricaulis sp.]